MLLLLILLIIAEDLAYTSSSNAGSTIFINRSAKTECWNQDDIVKLRARKTFENILPAPVNPDEINGKYIREMLGYFRRALHLAEQEPDPHAASLLREVLADTIGAHLRNDILPTARFAFYAGYVPYRNARQIHDFFDELKDMLNTRGLGWKRPERTPQWSNLTVAKILIGSGTFFDPCTCLVIKRDSKSCIHLPTPRLDDDATPSAIALPFKTGGLVSLTSPNSNNVLLKYYTTAARCILSSSPENCRHSDFLSFNNELWNWMKRDVAPHLVDEKLYTAYGGVLRIAAAVQTYGKGLSRRNLFEYQDAGLTKWHPWKSLTQSYVSINADWSPKLYVAAVMAIALAIYIIQIVYNYICGSKSCHCRGTTKGSTISDKVVCTVNSNSPAVLPHQSAVYYSNKRRVKRTSSKTRSASLGSVRTQKVYDLNENTEKLMAVIMSGNEDSASESSSSESVTDVAIQHPKSPPKIETFISEMRVGKRADRKFRSPMCSTSTVTRDTYGVEPHVSDSVWSESESCTSQSVTTSSKSNKSRSSRDLAWAKRVISKHSIRSTTKSISTSRTEIDLNSFTTPT